MTKQDAALFREFVSVHPSFSREQEDIDELVAFFYDLIRDEPSVLAKFDAAFRERYGYEADL